MKKLVMFTGLLIASLFFSAYVQAYASFEFIYPLVVQSLEDTLIFSGDRHGQFNGDYVAVLSDGSAWKIHPDCRETYVQWQPGEAVVVMVRNDWYWFKREHNFELYNNNRGEVAKAMIVQHKQHPQPLHIMTSEKEYGTGIGTNSLGPYSYSYLAHHYVRLNDGTLWDINNSGYRFSVGSQVYIGMQRVYFNDHAFVFISGDQREAQWTQATPKFNLLEIDGV